MVGGGTPKNPMRDASIKTKLIERNNCSKWYVFNTFFGVSFFLGNICGVFVKIK